jgi:hypothetical protein
MLCLAEGKSLGVGERLVGVQHHAGGASGACRRGASSCRAASRRRQAFEGLGVVRGSALILGAPQATAMSRAGSCSIAVDMRLGA